jgi:hypothetical protein
MDLRISWAQHCGASSTLPTESSFIAAIAISAAPRGGA